MRVEIKYRILNNSITIILLLALGISCSTNQSDILIKGKPIELKEPVHLNWIGQWKGEGLKEKLVRDIARQFEFENPDIKVNLKFHQELLNGKNELQYYYESLIAEKSEWDLIRINDRPADLAAYSSDPDFISKHIVDFSNDKDFINNHIPGFFDDPGFKAKWNNTLPGVALDGSDAVLWCNVELAKKIGIEVKQFGMTFDDFISYLEALNKYNSTNNTDYIGIFEANGWTWSLLNFIPQQLFSSEIGDYNKIKSEEFDEIKMAALEKTVYGLEQLSKLNPLPKNDEFTWANDKSFPLKGTCLFYPQASFMYNIWLNADSSATQNMIPLQLPEFKPSVSYPGSVSVIWMIPANSPNKEQSIRLMKFLATPQVADMWVRYTKSPTAVKNSLSSNKLGVDAYENYEITINTKFNKTKVPFPKNSEFFLGLKNSHINLDFKSLILGKISAKEFLSGIKSKLK